MKTINKVVEIDNNRGDIREIIEFNGKKFKLKASLRNGSSELEAQIMDNNGVFQFVLAGLDAGFKYQASYVSDRNRKEADMLTGIDAMKTLIKKVYS
jgi:hypothetical protein